MPRGIKGSGPTNAEKLRAARLKDPEHHRALRTKWREENRDKARQCAREWYARNKERLREKNRAVWKARRALRRKVPGALKPKDIIEILELQGRRCAVCSVKLLDHYHADHIIPISRGGLNERRNIQVLCPPCNMSKGAKDPASFMRSRGFLL